MGVPITGIILAGGDNSRMKTAKALLDVGGRRIIDRQVEVLDGLFEQIIVVSGSQEGFSGLDVRVVPDDERFRGVKSPLTGVYTGLKQAGGDCFVVACDMPFISPGLVARLVELGSGHRLVIPVVRGYAEPLFGVYPHSALGAVQDVLSRGGRRMRDLFGLLDVLAVGEEELRRFDPGLRSFVNINTPYDLDRARELVREPGFAVHDGVLV